MVRTEIKEIKIESRNKSYLNLGVTLQTIFRGKFISLNFYIKKLERDHITLSYTELLEPKIHNNHKRLQPEIVKCEAKINEIKRRNTQNQ